MKSIIAISFRWHCRKMLMCLTSNQHCWSWSAAPFRSMSKSLVSETQVGRLAALSDIVRGFAEMRENLRVNVWCYLLAPNASSRAVVRVAFDEEDREFNVLLKDCADNWLVNKLGCRQNGNTRT